MIRLENNSFRNTPKESLLPIPSANSLIATVSLEIVTTAEVVAIVAIIIALGVCLLLMVVPGIGH